MNMKRFVATDMRQAITLVKNTLGADAVIISSRKTAEGVEILASDDYSENVASERAPQANVAATKARESDSLSSLFSPPSDHDQQRQMAFSDKTKYAPHSVEPALIERFDDDVVNISSQSRQAILKKQPTVQNKSPSYKEDQQTLANFLADKLDMEAPQAPATHKKSSHQAAGFEEKAWKAASTIRDEVTEEAHISSEEMHGLRNEMKNMRSLLENQCVLLDWKRQNEQNPLRLSLLKRFSEMGLSDALSARLTDEVGYIDDLESASEQALKALVGKINCSHEDIWMQGGLIAMVGPTGVGKTTTIAKLAARYVMQHGAEKVALVTTDTYRIGAQEQLMHYGKLLGVPVYVVENGKSLRDMMDSLRDKKLVLVDTAGMSQRDMRLYDQLQNTLNVASMKTCLVLSANAHASNLGEVVKAFSHTNICGCVLTKTDEAVSLGAAISTLVKHRLCLLYCSNGQRVPEDIELAKSHNLVSQALEMLKDYRDIHSEDSMAFSFSEVSAHASL